MYTDKTKDSGRWGRGREDIGKKIDGKKIGKKLSERDGGFAFFLPFLVLHFPTLRLRPLFHSSDIGKKIDGKKTGRTRFV